MEWMGDPTGWAAEAMTLREGRWKADASVPVGRYRLLVRADGGPWVPPLGMPVVVDEFGRAGLLVVEGCGSS